MPGRWAVVLNDAASQESTARKGCMRCFNFTRSRTARVSDASSYEVCKKFGVASAIFSEEAGGVIQGVLVNKSPSPPVEE